MMALSGESSAFMGFQENKFEALHQDMPSRRPSVAMGPVSGMSMKS